MNKAIKYYKQKSVKGAGLMLLLLFLLQFKVFGNDDPKCKVDQTGPHLVKEFTIDGAGTLKAFTISGNIDVWSVSETNKVRVELYVERGYAFWSNSKNLDNYRINIFQRGNEIIASVEQKQKNTGFFSDKMTFSYKIYVPKTMSTDLKTLGGNIKLSGVKGNQLAKTSGGDIELNNLYGHIGAYTAGGTIDISGSKGTIFAHTFGGNIHVENSEGELRLKTAGGNILSQQISGSFVARSDGGNIWAQFVKVGEGISMETSAGNIYAEVPAHTGFNLFATASRIDFGAENFHGEKSNQKVDGRINEGGIPLRLQTSSGTITVKVE